MVTRKTVATNTILLLCCVICLLIHVFPTNNTIINGILFGGFYKPFILAGEFWRLFTVGFVHIEFWHLAMNMMALYSLGRMFETVLGTKKYLIILFTSIIGESLFIMASPQNTFVVGLSGGLYGLMAAYVTLIIRSGGWRIPPVRAGLINMILINALLNFLPEISVYGHLGGFVTGFLVYGMMTSKKEEKSRKIHYRFALGALFVAVLFMGYQNRQIPLSQRYLRIDIDVLQVEKNGFLSSYADTLANRLDNVYGLDFKLGSYLK